MTKRFANGMSVEDTLDTLRRAQELAEELYMVLSVVDVGMVRNYLLPAVADLVEGEGANPYNGSIPKAMKEVKDDAEYLEDEGEETDGDDLV